MKILRICVPKDNINKVKKTIDRMGEIFAKHLSDKGLIFNMYRENSATTKKSHNSKMGQGLE